MKRGFILLTTLIFYCLIYSLINYLLFSATIYFQILNKNELLIKRNHIEYQYIQQIKSAYANQNFETTTIEIETETIVIDYDSTTVNVNVYGAVNYKAILTYDYECNCILNHQYFPDSSSY